VAGRRTIMLIGIALGVGLLAGLITLVLIVGPAFLD
jgi:hypothetical protein